MNQRRCRIMAKVMLAAITMITSAGCTKKLPTSAPLIVAQTTGTVFVTSAHARELRTVIGVATASLKDTMESLNADKPNGELAKLNRVGGSARLPLTRVTFRALDLGRYYHDLTGGAYDYTTTPLARLWETGEPSAHDWKAAEPYHGMQFIEPSENGTISITKPGVVVHPGRMAHAYALDLATVEVRRKIKHPFLITWGAVARGEGTFPADEIPDIAVRLPAATGYITIGSVQLREHNALAQREGKTAIIIDPATGRPAYGTLLAVVVGPLAIKAHVLAEALYILGVEKGAAILPNFPEYGVMIIPNNEPLTCWMTEGFSSVFEPSVPMAVATLQPGNTAAVTEP